MVLSFKGVQICLAGMLGAASRQASLKSQEELKQISPRDLNDYVKKDNTTKAILVDVPSTATITEESLEVNDLLLTGNHNERTTIYLSNKTQSLEKTNR